MHSDVIVKLCSKSSRICCSGPFSPRMVFGFKLSLSLVHCIYNADCHRSWTNTHV